MMVHAKSYMRRMASEGIEMRKWMLLIVAGAMILDLSVGAPAQSRKKMPKKTALICPVTGDKIASNKAAVGHSTYKGKTYYFCCGMCKPRFDKGPGKFVANAAKGRFERM